MKLNMLFLLMDLLIMLAYPIVLGHNKLRRVSRAEKGIPPLNFLVQVPANLGI